MAKKKYYEEVLGLELPKRAVVVIEFMAGLNYYVRWVDAPEGELENMLEAWMSRKAAVEFCNLHGYEICPTKRAPDRLRRSAAATVPLQLSLFADVPPATIGGR